MGQYFRGLGLIFSDSFPVSYLLYNSYFGSVLLSSSGLDMLIIAFNISLNLEVIHSLPVLCELVWINLNGDCA